MSEEIYHPGVDVKRNGQILTLSEKARIMWSDTTQVTITVDATFLSKPTILELLNVAEDAFPVLSPLPDQHINLEINDSTLDSATFISAVLKTQVSPLMKVALAKSGRLVVKYLGLNSALELLAAKVKGCEDVELDYSASLTVSHPESYLFLLPGIVLGKQVLPEDQAISQKDVEDIFETEGITQMVSFVAENDPSITLDVYLFSDVRKLEPKMDEVYGSSVRTLAKISKNYKKAIGKLTSPQLEELIDLVKLCDLDSYPIEMLVTRIGLQRTANGYHHELVTEYQVIPDYFPKVCTEHLIPAFTLDEMKKLSSDARDLHFLPGESKIFSTHLHSPVDFLLAEVAVQKGVSRYAELCNFISEKRRSVSDWEEKHPSMYFNKRLDKYLMKIAKEVLNSENDDVPIAWIAQICQHRMTDRPL